MTTHARTIRNNVIQNNDVGILAHNPSSNKIYHNNFVGNRVKSRVKVQPTLGMTDILQAAIIGTIILELMKTTMGSVTDHTSLMPIIKDRYPFMNFVPKAGSSPSVKVDLTHVFIGIATIIGVAALAYLVRIRMSANKKNRRIENQ